MMCWKMSCSSNALAAGSAIFCVVLAYCWFQVDYTLEHWGLPLASGHPAFRQVMLAFMEESPKIASSQYFAIGRRGSALA
jgi:hypothetical protein